MILPLTRQREKGLAGRRACSRSLFRASSSRFVILREAKTYEIVGAADAVKECMGPSARKTAPRDDKPLVSWCANLGSLMRLQV